MALSRQELPASEDNFALVTALFAYLDRRIDSVDEGLGLRPMAGQRNPRTVDALRKRDAFLRQAAREFRLGAKALANALEAYTTRGSWRADRHFEECPERLVGDIRELLWRALKCHPNSIGERRVESILRDRNELPDFISD